MTWFPDWSNDVAVVVASGPSVQQSDAEVIRASGAKIVAVNSSVDLVPFADVCYATDAAWWRARRGLPKFGGLRVSAGKGIQSVYPQVHRVHVPDKHDSRRPTIILRPKGLIGSGGNSGFQALNLAAQFGARRIVLVGFDLHLRNGSHWHGDHPEGLRNPQHDLIDKWRECLDKQYHTFVCNSIKVVNASMVSALVNYPKMPLKEALA